MTITDKAARRLLIVWAVCVGIMLGSGLLGAVMTSCAPGKHRANPGEYVHVTPSHR